MTDCKNQHVYSAVFGYEGDTSLANLVILSIMIPIQVGFTVGILCLACKAGKAKSQAKKDKERGEDREVEPVRVREGSDYIAEEAVPRNKKKNNMQQRPGNGEPEPGFLTKMQTNIYEFSSMTKLRVFAILSFMLSVVGVLFVMIAVLSSEQAFSQNLPQAECQINRTTDALVSGSREWIGISEMVPNLTKLALDLNSRVKVSQNAIKALLLNGTVAAFPIGFPVVTTSSITVAQFFDATLRPWLTKNSSLSGIHQFPICQTSTISNIPHPLNDVGTIQLDYMDSICSNLTAEVDQLVDNGRALDDLQVLIQSVLNTRTSINANLTSYNSTISEISLRSSEYQTQFSSVTVDTQFPRAVPIVLFVLALVFIALQIGLFCFQCCRTQKHKAFTQGIIVQPTTGRLIKVRHNGEQSGMRINPEQDVRQAAAEILDNMSVSDQSQLTPSEIQIKKHAKLRGMVRNGLLAGRKTTGTFFGLACLINLLIGLSPLLYTVFINTGTDYCSKFQAAKNGEISLSSIDFLTQSERELLLPIQACTSAQNQYFLQTPDNPVYRQNFQTLYSISQLYNETTPPSVFATASLTQTQILKEYLLHMETMPIKSQDFDIEDLLAQLNTYTNGSSTSSQQIAECGSSVVKDQYVYNAVDCCFTLIDYPNQILTTEARCLQIPTYNGSGGTNESDLNDAQHSIVLNTSCTSVFNFYDSSNSNCFLGKRGVLLTNEGCTSTLTEYSRRLKNLVKFSVQAASYTNAYLQNLRNYFGVYAVLSTNLTEFFNGNNMSETLNQFGVLSHNLLNKTSCSYIQEQVDTLYSLYCPSSNSVSMLLYDCYVWIYISYFIICFAILTLFLADSMIRIEYVHKNQSLNELQKVYQQLDANKNTMQSQNSRSGRKMMKGELSGKRDKRVQISEQTLQNEDYDEERIQRREMVLEMEEPNIFNLRNSEEHYSQFERHPPLSQRQKTQKTQLKEKKMQDSRGSYIHERDFKTEDKNFQTEELQDFQDQEEQQQIQPQYQKQTNQAINYKGNKNNEKRYRNTYSQQSYKNVRKVYAQGEKNYPAFFEDGTSGVIDSDDSKRIKPKQYILKKELNLNKEGGRFSKQQIRAHKRQNELKNIKNRDIRDVTKQGQQSQRLKIIEIQGILNDNIDLVQLKKMGMNEPRESHRVVQIKEKHPRQEEEKE